MVATKNTELRKLRPAEFYNLAMILSSSDSWKKLVSIITKDDGTLKFDGESITILEQASRTERKPAAAMFLEEWSTMGRNRPTLGLLLEYLMKAELFRAADYLAEEILKVEAPARPSCGPAGTVDVEEALVEILSRQNINENEIGSDLPSQSQINLSRIDYPMHLLETERSDSDNNFAADENEIGIIEMRCDQTKSHQVLDHAALLGRLAEEKPTMFEMTEEHGDVNKLEDNEENVQDGKSLKSLEEAEIPDLIKFSKECETFEIQGITPLDFIKLHSANMGSQKNMKSETCETMLPNFNALRGDSSVDCNDEITSEKSHDNAIREMSSSELPAMLKEFELPNYFNRELTTSELPVCINDRSGFDTGETNFSGVESSYYSSSILNSDSSGSLDTTPNEDESEKTIPESSIPKKTFDSQELPVTVLEFQQR